MSTAAITNFASFPVSPENETHAFLTCIHKPYATLSTNEPSVFESAPIVVNALSGEDAQDIIAKFASNHVDTTAALGKDVLVAKRTIASRDARFNGKDSKDLVGALHGMMSDVAATRDYDNASYLESVAGGVRSINGTCITQGRNAQRLSNIEDVREFYKKSFDIDGVAFAESMEEFACAIKSGKVRAFDSTKNYLVIPRSVRQAYSENIDIIVENIPVVYDEKSDYSASPKWYLNSWLGCRAA